VFFRQVLHQDLGCASYVVGGGGQALVVDPRWEIDVYVETPASSGCGSPTCSTPTTTPTTSQA